MRWLIVTSVIVSSSILGMITSYATVTHTKTIVPKPEENIVGIEDNEGDGIVDNPMLANNTNVEIDKSPEPSFTPSNVPPIEPYIDNDSKPYKLFLVMGTDVVYSYPGKKTHSTNGRTDAIMIVKMSDEKIDLISVPRDTRVYIPGFGYDKINAANVYGGPELVKKTIDNWLGIHIDDYALFNTFGVVQFVDLFGGVDFNVPKRMKYTDNSAKLHIDLYPGMQHLDGMKVHNFLRFRHDGMGDLSRVARQQEILKTMVPQILRPLNLIKIPSAIEIINKNIETNISTGKVLYLANKALQISDLKNKIVMHTLPGDGKMYKGGWYWFIDEAGSNKVLQEVGLREGYVAPDETKSYKANFKSNNRNEVSTTQ